MEDEDYESRQLFQRLSPEARQYAQPAPPEQDWPQGRKPQYCMVESEDGDWPVLRVFRDQAALARRVRDLEGQDVSVWPYYGVPITISRKVDGGPRVIFMPDDVAIRLDEKLTRVEELDTAVSLQEDGYLGPDEMIVVSDVPEPPAPKKKGKKPPTPPQGNFDEDPEE